MNEATARLAGALADGCRALGRFGASYPVYLEAPAASETIRATDLVAPTTLRLMAARAISEWSDRPLDEDPRAAVSRLMRRYCGSLVTAALVPLAADVGIDVSPMRVTFLIRNEMPMGTVLDVDELVVCAERPTRWPISGCGVGTLDELREVALGGLLRHLATTFEAVRAHARVSSSLLWSTAAEQIDLMNDNALEGLGEEGAAPFGELRQALLFGESLPGVAGPNPMRNLLYWESANDPEFPRPLQVRRVCCANFVVPGRTTIWCRTCGLITPAQRLKMWRAWRASVRS